ncbi:MAG TPA: beta-ketoacyl-[acyl-carrier-protein] synthase family protein [Thermoanaerobaculia bacterium]|nr:beta-ketoacyl-[acyl-carrier-protein] synthase family protein [Thermoanaerobaculia bacterium]
MSATREREVAITGLGAVTVFGQGVGALWNGLLSGASGLAPVTLFDATRFAARCAAEVKAPPPDPEGETVERGHLLALGAAREALGSLDGGFGGPGAAVVVGTTLGGNRLFTSWLDARRAGQGEGGAALPASTMSSATKLLARRFGARGPAWTVSVACASGTAAIGLAAELVRSGEVDRALAGGYDALSEFVFAGFDSLRALSTTTVRPFDASRDGLGLGEGAGFVLLEEAESASRRGAEVLALVSSYASASDAHHMTRPAPEGDGLVRALRGALEAAGVAASEIAFISTHGTGTVFNDRMEASAFTRFFGERAMELPMNSIKGAVGHTLGAAGALEAVMAVLGLRYGLLPPTANLLARDPALALDLVAHEPRRVASPRYALSTSSAFAGNNAALVLERA